MVSAVGVAQISGGGGKKYDLSKNKIQIFGVNIFQYISYMMKVKTSLERKKKFLCHAVLPWVFGRNLRRS
jgi:hypothetical protein